MIRVLIGAEILTELVGQIKRAEKSIEALMFEWNWYSGQRTGTVQDINRELAIKAKTGLAVRVLLHNEAMGRNLGKINRRTAGHLRKAGAEVKMGNTKNPVHAKVWLFDRERVIVGSHNISSRALGTNIETSVLFDDGEGVEKIGEWFEKVWGKGITEPQDR